MPNLAIIIPMFLIPFVIIFAWQPIAKKLKPDYKPETGLSGTTAGQTIALIVWVILFGVTIPFLFQKL